MTAQGVSAEAALRGPRRSRRIDLRHPATLINSDGESVAITILDISSDGFRIALSELLREGERITIIEGKECLEGEIRWALGSEAGGVFVS
jgi:hypothetical protein